MLTILKLEIYLQDHMWQYRQEERDLRRAENDIVRQQKYMQTKLKKFENGNYIHVHCTCICTCVCIVDQ